MTKIPPKSKNYQNTPINLKNDWNTPKATTPLYIVVLIFLIGVVTLSYNQVCSQTLCYGIYGILIFLFLLLFMISHLHS